MWFKLQPSYFSNNVGICYIENRLSAAKIIFVISKVVNEVIQIFLYQKIQRNPSTKKCNENMTPLYVAKISVWFGLNHSTLEVH